MTRIVRKFGNGILGICLLMLGLDPANVRAISGRGEGRPPSELHRRSVLAGMGLALRSFGPEEWTSFAKRFDDDPSGSSNARLIVVPLSLAHVELNDYELSGSSAARERALARLEFVVAREAAWTARSGSGGAAAYLAISVTRLARECDVGDLGERIEAVQQETARILRAETSSRGTDGLALGSDPEAAADSAAVFAAAANLQPGTDESKAWELASRELAKKALVRCASPESVLFVSEGALSFVIAGRGVPPEFGRVPSVSWKSGVVACRATVAWSAGEERAQTDPLDEPTASVLSESRAVALLLLEHFLWTYPPGSDCPGEAPVDDV